MHVVSLPALIDCHVHFREPGYPKKGDMETESRSGIAGGIHTVCDMPNTEPATTTEEAFREKVVRAKRVPGCDIRFFFGITHRMHLEELRHVAANPDLRAKLVGVKLYFDHSTGDQRAEGDTVAEAFRVCAELDLPVSCHCEDATVNLSARENVTKRGIEAHSLLRPPEAEALAVENAIELSRIHGTRIHIAHLSTKEGVQFVREAKEKGIRVTCEAAPHHLFLTTEDYASLGVLAKMNPPLRSRSNRDALWAGIEDGTVDCIASDHAPHTLEEKQDPDPLKAPSGVPGVETLLPLLLTVASGTWPHPSSRKPSLRFGLDDIIRLCFEQPNAIFRIGKSREETIDVDLDAGWTIRGKDLHAKCGWTPYEGWKVRGKVVRTK